MEPRQPNDEHRVAPRYRLSIPALYTSNAFTGTGLVHDMSTSGALIGNTESVPTRGARLQIRLLALRTVLRLDCPDSLNLDAAVVRRTDTDFAVCFVGDTHELTRILDRVGARGAKANQ